MKTTMMFRNIANPRRTTLAHLEDADALQTPEQPEHCGSTSHPDRQPPPHHPDGSPGRGCRRRVVRTRTAADSPRRGRPPRRAERSDAGGSWAAEAPIADGRHAW